ncbi:unnamed protein product, partial [Symbiodinium pilosum]
MVEAEDDEVHGVEAMLDTLTAPVKVVYTVALEEVKRRMMKWKAAILKEFQALWDAHALTPLSEAERQALEGSGTLFVLPAKGVFTIKPPDEVALPAPESVAAHADSLFKRKARLLICGNFEGKQGEDSYAGGCQMDLLRTMLARAVHCEWHGAITDIRNAFLLAPLDTGSVTYALFMPKVFRMAEVPCADQLFRVDRALCGFRRSPRLWGLYRDGRLRRGEFDYGSSRAVLRQLRTDENTWASVLLHNEEIIGYITVYVDDLLCVGTVEAITAAHTWLASESKTSGLAWIGQDEPVRFLGTELLRSANGFSLFQRGYLKEVLKHHSLLEAPGSLTPCPQNWLLCEVDLEAVAYSEEILARAQKLTGELLWLSTRSRPDVMHAVSTMSSLCLRKPVLAERIGLRTLAYLKETFDYVLKYGRAECSDRNIVIAYSDASFAPQGGRSLGCSMVCYNGVPVAWRCGRQTLVSLSVAEAELIEAINAVQMLSGIAAFTAELHNEPPAVRENALRIEHIPGLKASEAVQHELELQGLSGRDPSPGDELPELEEIPFQSPPRHTREWRSVSSVSIGVQADVRLPPGEVVMSVQQPLYVTKN